MSVKEVAFVRRFLLTCMRCLLLERGLDIWIISVPPMCLR